jgi:site-specific recombinase XerD
MDQLYNLYNLEASFRKFLIAENNSAVTVNNYLSDYRHFCGWHQSEIQPRLFNASLIQAYVSYLQESNIPIKTVNRRLSTLRKFGSFCISQGWMKENPAKHISNMAVNSPKSTVRDETLKEFENFLSDNDNKQSIISDIAEFLNIIN